MQIKNDASLIRRKYNQWVANETLEDYALRYTAKKARRWSTGWVANTALGIVAFLALEAIGGRITLDYGFTNAMWAILVVGMIIFLSGLPLAYFSARDGVDIDLLTRGAGFGYLGSTISSLIYASFTFIFFALEAAIMSMALHMMTGIPLSLAYIISTVMVIPLVTHGISRISLFQAWTQPIWLALQILPLIFIAMHHSSAFEQWVTFHGSKTTSGHGFNLLYFGAAAAVIFPLIAQNCEQADFLRFLPVRNQQNKTHWWIAVIGAGPGWVIFGMIKLFIGSFLTVLILNKGSLPASLATDPAHMYAVAFSYIFSNSTVALWVAGIFVVISQLKINITNAYAGSIAWGNFFSRLTHSHPGRVVWLIFNVSIALMLMELGLYQAFEKILVIYASLVVAWIGSVVADLVINKPLGLSPPHIEFRRSHLYDINPVGVISMLLASCAGIAANIGILGDTAQALSAFISLALPFVTVPFIAWVTKSRYYLCRQQKHTVAETSQQQCLMCENYFDSEDMGNCPSYNGTICSLCCALDSRCDNQCRPDAHLAAQTAAVFSRFLPPAANKLVHSVTGHFLGIFIITTTIIAGLLTVVFYAKQNESIVGLIFISATLWRVFFLLMLVTGVLIWLYVLAQKSARFALSESQQQANLLSNEVNAHKITAVELEKARDAANAANLAKTRYLSGVSHELRSPLNTILGYAQLMETDTNLDKKFQKISTIIRHSGEHLSDVIEGLLEISKIEARKLNLQKDTVDLTILVEQLKDMFHPLAKTKGINFEVVHQTNLPRYVTTDEKRIRQILLNLISNAIKFTPTGKVELNLSYRNQVARMSVIDTGIGIADKDQIRIFDPFERVHNSKTQLINGTGLGLSISHLLTKVMGGNLELNSQIGHGTEFCLSIFLPAADDTHITIKQNYSDITGYHGEPKHIMIVDDEYNHRQLIIEFLTPLGFIMHQAKSAEQALDIFSKQTIDLFLLDLNMPEMNGKQLLLKLRDRGFRDSVIILSANADKDALPERGLMGFQSFINKPVRLEKLLEQLQNCLNLQWCYNKKIENITADNQADNLILELDVDTITSLRNFARMGYLTGVIECIKSLEFKNQKLHFFLQLQQMADKCDMAGITKLTDKLIKEGLTK